MFIFKTMNISFRVWNIQNKIKAFATKIANNSVWVECDDVWHEVKK